MTHFQAQSTSVSPASLSHLSISNLERDARNATMTDDEADVDIIMNRPPTPAPSPTPDDADATPSWGVASADEDFALRNVRGHFANLKTDGRQRFLTELLNMCTSYELASVAAYVSPRLKKDFLKCLPVELSLRVRITRWGSEHRLIMTGPPLH